MCIPLQFAGAIAISGLGPVPLTLGFDCGLQMGPLQGMKSQSSGFAALSHNDDMGRLD